jgi:hypothetical protein
VEQIKSSLQDGLKEQVIPVTNLEMEKTGQMVLEFSGGRRRVSVRSASVRWGSMKTIA